MIVDHEYQEGDRCPLCDDGQIVVMRDPWTCCCGVVPATCPACENSWLECNECGAWKDEFYESSDSPSSTNGDKIMDAVRNFCS